jgi:hypothetical protein
VDSKVPFFIIITINYVVKTYGYKKIIDGWSVICKTIGDGPNG